MSTFRMLPAILAAAFTVAAGSARAEMKRDWVEYSHGDTKLKAYMVYDDEIAGKRPAVFMIHARDGMTESTLARQRGIDRYGGAHVQAVVRHLS